MQVFVEGLPKLDNEHEKAKTFEIIELRNIKGNVDAPFGSKRYSSYAAINPAKFFAKNNLWATLYGKICKNT